MNNIEGLENEVEQLFFADLFMRFDSVRFDLYVFDVIASLKFEIFFTSLGWIWLRL